MARGLSPKQLEIVFFTYQTQPQRIVTQQDILVELYDYDRHYGRKRKYHARKRNKEKVEEWERGKTV